MPAKEYSEEFCRLEIRYRHVDDEVQKVARQLNGLRSKILDEISFLKLDGVEEAYQYELKAKEILKNKHD